MALALRCPLILSSQSPRRQQLLRESGFVFEIQIPDVDETVEPSWALEDVAVNIAVLKAEAVMKRIPSADRVILAADTIVAIDDQVLGKPGNKEEAMSMLRKMSGRVHEVYTGVAFRGVLHCNILVRSRVEFDILSESEMNYYIDTCNPYDKAGSYGVQEWLGHCKIKWIEGSFTNIMGLPMHEVYQTLRPLLQIEL
jgi:septum formation protein